MNILQHRSDVSVDLVMTQAYGQVSHSNHGGVFWIRKSQHFLARWLFLYNRKTSQIFWLPSLPFQFNKKKLVWNGLGFFYPNTKILLPLFQSSLILKCCWQLLWPSTSEVTVPTRELLVSLSVINRETIKVDVARALKEEKTIMNWKLWLQ